MGCPLHQNETTFFNSWRKNILFIFSYYFIIVWYSNLLILPSRPDICLLLDLLYWLVRLCHDYLIWFIELSCLRFQLHIFSIFISLLNSFIILVLTFMFCSTICFYCLLIHPGIFAPFDFIEHFSQLPYNYSFECLVWDSNQVHSYGNPLLLNLPFLEALCCLGYF